MTETVPFGPPLSAGKFVMEISEPHKLVRVSTQTFATPDEINAFRAGPLRKTGCTRIVWDLAGAGFVDIGRKEAEKFAKFIPDVPEGNKLAFVVSSEVSFGVGRMISTHMNLAGNPARIRPFYDMSEALAWLISEEAED